MSKRLAGTWWLENLLRPMLIAAMLACLATPLALVLAWLIEGWDGTYFLVFVFFAGLEGILSERVLHKQRISGWAYLASRGAEALILLVVLKVINYLPLGLGQLWAEALTWPSHPDLLISNLDLLTGAVFLPMWGVSLYVGRLVSELDVHSGEVTAPLDKTSTAYYLWLTQPSPVRDRQERLDWLGEVFLWGGIVLLVASAGIHGALPATGIPAVPTLLYFALGVALLSQARFSVTHTTWQMHNIPVQEGIGRRWLVWAVVFLVGVAFVALLLPTRYAMGPVQALLAAISFIVQVVTLAVSFALALIMLLLSFFLPSVQPTPQPTQAPQLLPPMEPGASSSSTPWLQVLVSVLFWATILAIVGYSVLRFLQDRFDLFARSEKAAGTWWGRFLSWLQTFWSQWRAWRQEVQEELARRWPKRQRARPGPGDLFRFLSVRRLPPRERIRFFYLSTARRAAQAGRPRRPGETPYEYRSDLEAHFPDLEPSDLSGLTDAFIQARYDRRPVQAEDAEAVKPLWQRIKTVLRKKVAGGRL
jgi:hypothetical protein